MDYKIKYLVRGGGMVDDRLQLDGLNKTSLSKWKNQPKIFKQPNIIDQIISWISYHFTIYDSIACAQNICMKKSDHLSNLK